MAATNSEVWQRAVVLVATAVADQIQRIEIETSLPAKADPGSHIDVMVVADGQREKRSYSIVEASPDGRYLTISVFRAPASRGGSVFMHTLRPGDTIEITQPLQNFPLRVGAETYVLLAGGIGITAIANMASALRTLKADYRLVYAGRSRAAMAYLDELMAMHGDRIVVHVDDGHGHPADSAVVTLESPGRDGAPPAPATHTIDQRDETFIPYVEVMRPGEQVHLKADPSRVLVFNEGAR